MNLETKMDERLWEAIQTSVEARNFKGAVLDAIHYLTDVIRERSGLESDGVALVGDAFGGSSPKLKLNRMQSDTERNIQEGTHFLLRGMYQAIRNPRSHEQHQDTEQDARAIILFIDYLLRGVSQSTSPFSLTGFVARVLDPDYVPTAHYSALLVAGIPTNKRLAVCREVFAQRANADGTKLKWFYEAILDELPDHEIEEFASIVSDELLYTHDDDTICFVLRALHFLWPKVSEPARLRIEYKLIGSVKVGAVSKTGQFRNGSLGTFLQRIIKHVSLKGELSRAMCARLDSPYAEAQDYVLGYLLPFCDDIFKAPPPSLVRIVNEGLRKGDKRYQLQAEAWAKGWHNELIDERGLDHPWIKPFAEALADFTEKPDVLETDDIPF